VLGVGLKPQSGLEGGRWRYIRFDAGKVRVDAQSARQPVGKTENDWHVAKISLVSFEHELQRRRANGDDDIRSAVVIFAKVKMTKLLLIDWIWKLRCLHEFAIKLDSVRSVVEGGSYSLIDEIGQRLISAGFIENQDAADLFRLERGRALEEQKEAEEKRMHRLQTGEDIRSLPHTVLGTPRTAVFRSHGSLVSPFEIDTFHLVSKADD